jgi:hypothetical protein
LLDVSRYLDAFSACDLVPVEEPKAPDPDTQRRFYKPEDDLQDEADEFELDF